MCMILFNCFDTTMSSSLPCRLEHWGSDTQGINNTRRFLLEWLSFTHRYVPVGLVENPPQRLHQKPPSYRGREVS
jgi:tRNA-dihydrouridine synthase 3